MCTTTYHIVFILKSIAQAHRALECKYPDGYSVLAVSTIKKHDSLTLQHLQ